MLSFKYLAAFVRSTDFYQLNRRCVAAVMHDSFPIRLDIRQQRLRSSF